MVETNRINMIFTPEEMEKITVIKNRTGLTMNTEVIRYCITELSKDSKLYETIFKSKKIQDIDNP